MGISQDDIDRAIEMFRAAGVGEVGWRTALETLADVTGSTGSQLIGLGSRALVPFNLMTGIAPEASEDFAASGGGDPRINSRIRIGSQAAELVVLDEADFTTASDMRRSPRYADWMQRHDMYHACLTNLSRSPGALVGLALTRSARQGNVDAEQKRAFGVLARHARAAIRTQILLHHQSAAMVAEVLETLRATAFLCDVSGRVCAMTRSAEAMAVDGDILRLQNGFLVPALGADRPAFEAALSGALSGDAEPRPPVPIHSLAGHDAVLLEASTLPSAQDPNLGARALVLVHGISPDQSRLARAGRALYGLSASEAAVAALLSRGRSPSAIAVDRQVSVGTVRSQIRDIYRKAGVSSQLELAAALSRF